MFSAFRFLYYSMLFCKMTIIRSSLKHKVFISYSCRYSFFVHSILFFFSSAHALFHTFISECYFTPLQCFYKACIQSNQLLTLTRKPCQLKPSNSALIMQYDSRPSPQVSFILSCPSTMSI
jgi:hypothetical protein